MDEESSARGMNMPPITWAWFITKGVYIFCVVDSIFRLTEAASHFTDGSWTATPVDLFVLEGTPATLGWTYANMDPGNIAWDFVDSTGTQRDFIMAISNGKEVRSDKWRTSAIYQNFSGSATLVLVNVTPANTGKYKVKVLNSEKDEHGRIEYIEDEVLLTVVPPSDLTYILAYNDEVHEMSVGREGSNVNLPTSDLFDPAKVQVLVNVTARKLKPSLIRVQMPSGIENYSDYLCENSYVCRRKEWVILDDIRQKEFYIFTTIDFPVENLEAVTISKMYILRGKTAEKPTITVVPAETHPPSPPDARNNWIAGVSVAAVCICAAGIVVWCKWDCIKGKISSRRGTDTGLSNGQAHPQMSLMKTTDSRDITSADSDANQQTPLNTSQEFIESSDIETTRTCFELAAVDNKGQSSSSGSLSDSRRKGATASRVHAVDAIYNPTSLTLAPSTQISEKTKAAPIETKDRKQHGHVTPVDLNKHVIKEIKEYLLFADYMFKFEGDTLLQAMENIGNTGSWQAVSELAALLTALLNTSGGIVILYFVGNETSHLRDLTTFFSSKFVAEWKIIPAHIWKKNIKIHKVSLVEVHIMVAKAPFPITYDYHTYVREVKECNDLHDYETVKKLISNAALNVRSILLDTDVPLDPNIDAIVYLAPEANLDVFIMELIAMGNALDGGYIVLNDHLSRSGNPLTITEEIKKLVASQDNATRQWDMIKWGSHEGFPKNGDHWTVCKFRIAVDWNSSNVSEADQQYWIMKVNACQGGAFLRSPECFVVRDDGIVEQLEFEAWTDFVNSGTLDLNIHTEKISSIDEGDNISTTDDRVPGANQQSCGETIGSAISKKWSDTESWKQASATSNENHPYDVSLPGFQFPSFRISNPLTCTPRRVVIEETLRHTNYIRRFRKVCEANIGWLLAFPSIIQAFNNDAHLDIPSELCMDLLVKVGHNHFKVVSIFVGNVKDGRHYSYCAARVWKKHLLNEIERRRTSEQGDPSVCVEVSWIMGDHEFNMDEGLVVNNTVLNSEADVSLTDHAIVNLLMTSKNNVMADLMKNQTTKDQNDVANASEVSHLVVTGPSDSGLMRHPEQ